MKFSSILVLASVCCLAVSCSEPSSEKKNNNKDPEWEEILASSSGSTVDLMMWQGDPLINAYIEKYVKPELKNRFDISLNVLSGQGNEIVNLLLSEKEMGKQNSQIDICWINGETFYQLRQLDALYGPFVHHLPNNQLIDWNNSFIANDFQQPVDYMECPWGNVQLTFIYDSSRVSPPGSFSDIPHFVKEHPGRFTIPVEFTGMTMLKSWLISISGKNELNGPFDEEKYQKYSQILWATINDHKKYFWHEGKTFPSSLAAMHQMFANGELLLTFSNNDCEVDNKIAQGVFPSTSYAYVPDPGTIRNTHYMGIAKNSQDINASLVVLNFLISPEAQFEKMKPEVWGDYTILDISRINPSVSVNFSSLPGRSHSPKREEIDDKAFQELSPEYMIRLYDDFRKFVINQ